MFLFFYSKQGDCEIHHYDPEGVHIGRVAHGLRNPLGMTFTPAGDLVVADLHSCNIFHRYEYCVQNSAAR